MRHPVIPIALALLLCAATLRAQDRKTATAVRVGGEVIRVDGVLDEDVWRRAAPITDFIQKEPVQGARADRRHGSALRLRRCAPSTSAPACEPATHARSRRRSAGVTSPTRPSTSSSRSTPSSTAAPRWCSASPRPASGSIAITPPTMRDLRRRLRPGVGGAHARSMPTGWSAELWIPFTQLRFNPRGSSPGASTSSASGRASTRRTPGC